MKKVKQCKSKHWMNLECQGASGHTNPHWAYSPNGCLEQWRNEKHIGKRWKLIGASSCPPGHAAYIHPKDMRKHYWIHLSLKRKKK